MRTIAAWGVHLFTACGAVLGAAALLAVGDGAWGRACLFMLAALAIDSVDGALARRVGVSGALPRIDGRRLDDIVDYLNYVIVPAVFLAAAGLVPHWAWVVPPILASAYGFSQVAAKTEDDFFLGFPSYWNVVAIYAWLMELSPGTTAAWLCGLSALVFVPLKYIYPSRLNRGRGATLALGCLWMLVMTWAVLAPARARELGVVAATLLFPAWYVGLSAHLGGWLRPRRIA